MAKRLPAERLHELDALLRASPVDDSMLSGLDWDIASCLFDEESSRDYSAMSEPRRKYLACYYLETEINHGGLNQFMFDKGPDIVRDALAFLDERSIDHVASLLRDAISALPDGVLPDSHDELQEILDEDDDDPITRAHNELERRFFNLDPYPLLTLDRFRYAREHADEFFE